MTFDVFTSSFWNQPDSRGFLLSLSTVEIRLKIWIVNVLTPKEKRNISVELLWINYRHFKAVWCLIHDGFYCQQLAGAFLCSVVFSPATTMCFTHSHKPTDFPDWVSLWFWGWALSTMSRISFQILLFLLWEFLREHLAFVELFWGGQSQTSSQMAQVDQ